MLTQLDFRDTNRKEWRSSGKLKCTVWERERGREGERQSAREEREKEKAGRERLGGRERGRRERRRKLAEIGWEEERETEAGWEERERGRRERSGTRVNIVPLPSLPLSL
jgi:hypothetical protein